MPEWVKDLASKIKNGERVTDFISPSPRQLRRKCDKQKDNFKYMIATQDRELQSRVRMIAGTPLIYIHRKAPTLEPPSPTSVNEADKKIQRSIVLSDVERKNLKIAKAAILGPQQPLVIRKKKKAKGPNPLSCKKKKPDPKKDKGAVRNK